MKSIIPTRAGIQKLLSDLMLSRDYFAVLSDYLMIFEKILVLKINSNGVRKPGSDKRFDL